MGRPKLLLVFGGKRQDAEHFAHPSLALPYHVLRPIYTVSGHPLELYPDIAWDTYCPVSRLPNYIGQVVVLCGLIVVSRLHSQEGGESMKFMTLADHTGMVETELFSDTYRRHGLATVRFPVMEVFGTVEPFENNRGFSLRVHRAGKPRTRQEPI